MSRTLQKTSRPAADLLLRALAIASVVGIHVLSSKKQSPFIEGANWQWLSVGLDQFFRFSVPIFVALSGYGLLLKYGQSKFDLRAFWEKRVVKLIPSYLIWSLIFYLLFILVPAWQSSGQDSSFFIQLVFGRADYHLYFVPMIIQLYLMFPVILWLFKKQPLLVATSALILQALWFWHFGYQEKSPVSHHLFMEDKEQYVWASNWIWYFLLGMCLPKIHEFLQKIPFAKLACLVLIIMTWFFAAKNSLGIIAEGTDPLIALRFTRFPVMIFASASIIGLTFFVRNINKVPKPVEIIGKYSYHIYLAHTLVLRLIF